MAYRLHPSATPTVLPALASGPGGAAVLQQIEPGSQTPPPVDDQPTDTLPAGLLLSSFDDIEERLADAQQLLHPRELLVSRLSETDLSARLPGVVALRIQGGGVITAGVQGITYTVTIGASNGELIIGGLPPGVSAPALPAKILSATSEPGELIIVYQGTD
jgi:hypothetical protein